MKTNKTNISSIDIDSMLNEAKPDIRIPELADLKIREMIRANTADYTPAKKIFRFPSMKAALPLAAAFFCGMALTVFFATDYFTDALTQKPAWGKVLTFTGDVTSHSNGIQNRINTGSAVTGKSSFSTGAGSSCLVLLQDGSKLYLGENTTASFTQLSKGSRFIARIVLNRGSVSANIRKLSKGSEFSIRSGLLKAEVRGTEFMVSDGNGKPYVSVLDGAVKVSRTDKKASVFVHPMEKASVRERGIEINAISPSDETIIRQAAGTGETLRLEQSLLGETPAVSTAQEIVADKSPAPAVDAGKKTETAPSAYSLDVSAARGWVDSGIIVHSGDIIEISAGGSITTEQGGKAVGPNGEGNGNDRTRLCPSAPLGSLIMSPDGGRSTIYIGGADKFRATSEGRILFSVNDREKSFSDNSGLFKVNVKIMKK